MTGSLTELSETLSSIESIKSYLAGLVGAASANRNNEPVRLTYIGGEFAKAVGCPFEKHITALVDKAAIAVPKTSRKLAPFVEAYCGDILSLTESPSGVYFIHPLGGGEVDPDRPQNQRPVANLRFHRAVWAAFIRPLEGSRRFLNLDRIGYTNSAELPKEGNWREIEQRFVAGIPSGAPVDSSDLQARIEEWARQAEIPISSLVIGPAPHREAKRLNQLLEIIDALPATIAASWSIPAAVLKYLRDER